VLVGAGLEIDEGLIAEVAAGGKRKDDGRDLGGCHNSLVYRFHKYCVVIRTHAEQLFLTENLRQQKLQTPHLFL
jgi:hypothetical protein